VVCLDGIWADPLRLVSFILGGIHGTAFATLGLRTLPGPLPWGVEPTGSAACLRLLLLFYPAAWTLTGTLVGLGVTTVATVTERLRTVSAVWIMPSMNAWRILFFTPFPSGFLFY